MTVGTAGFRLVGFALVYVLSQGGRGNVGDVANINNTHFGGSGRSIKRTLKRDDGTETKQALHE